MLQVCVLSIDAADLIEPRQDKTCMRCFRPGTTHKPGCTAKKRWLEACNFGFRKNRDCTINVAKTKELPLIICRFVFAYTKNRFGHYAV